MKESLDLKVFITNRESVCDECKENLGKKAWIFLNRAKGALCLSCADLDHLVFLPSGDAALTRRSRKYSTLSAIVLKFSRARKRYERQGLLVEEVALEKAEQECLADSEARALSRQRAAVRREEIDRVYIKEFARRVLEVFPNCPKSRAGTIAQHACLKYSGRIGRSGSAKNFEEKAVCLAVRAHIRHRKTGYDELLMNGYERSTARDRVESKVRQVLTEWEGDYLP
ncbi:MAG: DUF2293 domain-containing protein [bacterium]|nr:DUF2293 domain-containing protein [bacterium]